MTNNKHQENANHNYNLKLELIKMLPIEFAKILENIFLYEDNQIILFSLGNAFPCRLAATILLSKNELPIYKRNKLRAMNRELMYMNRIAVQDGTPGKGVWF